MRFFRAVLMTAVFLAVGMNAWSEPYLAAWKGVNCNACHVNQTGGYLRNDFGKNYGNSLQTFDWQGISDAAQKIQHNTPMWVSTGLDIHQSYMATFYPQSYLNQNYFNQSGFGASPLPQHSSFSIQAKANEVVSGVFTYRIDEGGVGEFYALVSGMPEGGYLKFGRFLLPYGLGLSDDNSLIRYPFNQYFNFDEATAQPGMEAGIFPDPFFLNVALVNGIASAGTTLTPGYSEKIVSSTGGASFSDFTLAGSLHGENLDMENRLLLYGAYGWGRLGPAVLLAEYDSGYQGQGGSVPGPVTVQTNYDAYHLSVEFDLGSDVYLRFANERLNDSMHVGGNPNSPNSEGVRDVLTLRFYPVRNLKTQIDFIRFDPVTTVNNPDYAVMADAFMFY